MTGFDPKKIAADLKWLQDHPWFIEKPASIEEFLGPDYLNIAKGIRPGVRAELIEIFGKEVNGHRIALIRWGMFTGAIGIGKTTMASIVIPYMAHWVLCLKDPQEFYDLLPGSRIAFMQMSTSEDQAKETLFGDIKARIEYSPWFLNNYPYDPKFTNQIRFPGKDIWIIPGSSTETSFEGYNILGGILDEADSHKQTQTKDYAEVGFDTINSRIDSRFQDRGFLLVVGQMKKANGFAAMKYKELNDDPENAHTVRMTIWESLGWAKFSDSDGNRISFWYDKKRKQVVAKDVAELLGYPDHIIEIPKVYEKNFRNNPEKALRDLAGIPPLAGAAFISLSHKIEDAVELWKEHHGFDESPVSDDPLRPVIADWFMAQTPLARSVHLDIGLTNDAAGIAMGHISHLTTDDEGEEKPFIVIDCLIRVKAPKGTEVQLADLRKYIYDLKNRGFRIRTVTMDGFQSSDTRQQLRKKKFNVKYLSVDKSKLPYEDVRDALYEDRLALPPYVTYINLGDDKTVNIAVRELSELEDNGKKVDHTPNGSKDVADAIAGVVTTLMGDRTYRRNLRSTEQAEEQNDQLMGTGTDGNDPYGFGDLRAPGYGGMDLKAPIPPNLSGNVISFPIPHGLRPPKGV